MSKSFGSFIKIGCWNVNGLTNKLNEQEFITTTEGYDILCLQETKLERDCVTCFKNYQTHAIHRPYEKHFPASGGMLILVNLSIKTGISLIDNKCSEIQWVKLSKEYFSLENDLFVCFTYIAPDNSTYAIRHNLDILHTLQNDISHFGNLGDIMILGDTNARTGVTNDLLDANSLHLPSPYFNGNSGSFLERNSQDVICNSRGRDLIDLCLSSKLVILNGRTFGDLSGKLTSFQYNGNSVVDYCIISDVLFDKILYFQVENHIPWLSDHAKLNVKLYANFCRTINDNTLINFPPSWKWLDTSLLDFKIALSSIDIKKKIESYKNTSFNNVDEMVSNLNSIIYTACDKCLKKRKTLKKSGYTRPKKKWFDSDLKSMRKELLRKSYLYSRNPCDNVLKGAFFKFRKLYKRCCKQKMNMFKRSIITRLDSMLESNPSEYWELVNELKNEGQKNDPSDKIQSEVWIKHFTNLFSVRENFKHLDAKYASMLKDAEKIKSFSNLDFVITEKEITKTISSLKNKKSSGLDSITNEMLKASQLCLMPCFKKLFNCILSSGVYPSSWKVGYIKAIHKSGDTHDPNNYRGISVMSCMSKVFNYIMNNRLQKYIDNGIINAAQIGFQPNSRTSDHMFVVKTLIDKFFSKGSKLYTCFVDFSKAFDNIIHSLLLYKLCKNDISGPFYNIIKSMYQLNVMHIKIGDGLSESFCPEMGVRQGDNLSPNLFKLFINDLPSIFDRNDDPVCLYDLQFSCLLYADDLLLLSTSSKGLQNCLDKLSSYCENNGLIVNIKKTNIVTFCKNGKLSNEKYYFNGVEIEHATKYKYLGIIFSASGTFSYCQEDLYKRALKAYFKVSKVFGQLHQNVNSILHLFDHTVKPILLYGSEIWGIPNTSSSILNKTDYTLSKSFNNLYCDKLHVKFLKYVLGVHKKSTNQAVCGEIGRFPLYIDVICNIVKYCQRLANGKVSSLLSAAFKESKSLYVNKKDCWFSSVQHCFKHLNISDSELLNKNLVGLVKSKLVSMYKTNWCLNLSITDGKLRTYSSFKQRFSKEIYLTDIKDKKVRTFFTKFRISAHRLNIETGRYRNIPVDQRLCKCCTYGVVEDEVHFALSCPLYNGLRTELFAKINSQNINFKLLNDNQKFIWLMSCEDTIVLNAFAKYLLDCYELRSKMLSGSQ